MRSFRIAIVGGGLAGLYAAYLLERKGIHDYVLLEARVTLGGRIASLPAPTHREIKCTAEALDRFDLGPTWFWPDLQPELNQLISDLGLHHFAQFETGDAVVEHSSNEPPVRVRGYTNSPASMRLIGGMSSLIDALHSRLDEQRIITGFTVCKLRALENCIELEGTDTSGSTVNICAEHILLAAPPRMAEDAIECIPPLPDSLRAQWRKQPTWMAPHAKYIAIYPNPFWREVGLSGEARSRQGPLGEIHDASMPGGSAALFGFFAFPARMRKNMPEELLRAACRAQLVRMFGPQAAMPLAEGFKDWATDPYTATASDADDSSHPTERLSSEIMSGPWQDRLTGIASEWSSQFPGYLAGAVEAARAGVQSLPMRAESVPL